MPQIAIRDRSSLAPQRSNCADRKLSNKIPHGSYKDVLLHVGVVQRVQIERPHPGQQIHPVCSHEPTGLVPGVDFPEDEERNDDGRREIVLEKDGGVGRRMDRLLSKSA